MSRRLVLPLVLLAASPCRADEPSFPLTSDTLPYCVQLAHQITERHSANADIQRLLTEGRELCDRGQVRGGIRRLRRALVMLHHRAPAAPPQ